MHHLTEQRCGDRDVAQVQVGAAKSFDHEAGREAGLAETAERLGQLDAEETEAPHFSERLTVQAAFPVALPVVRFDAFAGKYPRCIDQLTLLVIKSEIHGPSMRREPRNREAAADGGTPGSMGTKCGSAGGCFTSGHS